MSNIIYLDNASKSIPYPEVIAKYNEVVTSYFANPSSIHGLGVRANRLLDQTRSEILKLFKLNNHNVLFTSGATESNNLAIKGYALKYKNRGKHIITSSYEHPSVLEVFAQLEKEFGFSVTYLVPDREGIISVEKVKAAIKDDTILVSLIAVNNEIGSINPIEDIAKLLKEYPKIAFHVDAAQAVGKVEKPINFNDVDMVTISAHKMHGLVGTGALLIKKNLQLLSLNTGGGQEYDLRSGTNDLAGATCLLEALKITLRDNQKHYQKVVQLRDILLNCLKNEPNLYHINSSENASPYIVNFSTLSKKSSVVVEALSNAGIMVSSTSACHAHNEKGSYVVKALGYEEKISKNTVRVSFSFMNEIEEVNALIDNLKRIIGEIR